AGNGGGSPVAGLGEKFRDGSGKVLYGSFSCLSKLMKYSVLKGGTAWNCWALSKCLPGVPSALTMPLDSRFETPSPLGETYVANRLSNERFSPISTMTCFIG